MAVDMKKTIARINELAKKKREGIALTPEEEAEKKELYRVYLDVIRGNLVNQLDNIELVEDNGDGTYTTIKEAKNFPKETKTDTSIS